MIFNEKLSNTFLDHASIFYMDNISYLYYYLFHIFYTIFKYSVFEPEYHLIRIEHL